MPPVGTPDNLRRLGLRFSRAWRSAYSAFLNNRDFDPHIQEAKRIYNKMAEALER